MLICLLLSCGVRYNAANSCGASSNSSLSLSSKVCPGDVGGVRGLVLRRLKDVSISESTSVALRFRLAFAAS